MLDRRSHFLWCLLLLSGVVGGCAKAHDVSAVASAAESASEASDSNAANHGSAGAGGGASDPPPAPEGLPDDCPPAEELATRLPEDFRCTGLYEDVVEKKIAPGVREFEPAYVLWSDGAVKTRWIYLPEDTQIDASDPNNWVFPDGTKLFKEFKWKGQRVETRLFQKVSDRRWIKTAYHWSEDESEATRFAGGEVEVAGDDYYIPSAKECDQCHKGRDDRALGFEQILLGMSGAQGMTLQTLIEEDLISPVPSDVDEIAIGDDGTGEADDVLGWMHVNCGVSCHNGNSNAEGYSSDLRLHLDATKIDGRPSDDFPARATGIGVQATTPRWSDQMRIVPGSPEESLLYYLASTRDPENPKDQMPPIASRVVDEDAMEQLADWIRGMPAD